MGVMQLSVVGVVAMACFFVSGVLVAELLYRKGNRHE
jgi:phosphoribosylaminoimidazole carboxylase (NCAIR synthetase)